jgi:hypothetical protein
MLVKKKKAKHVKFYLFLSTAGKEGMALMGSGIASFIGGVVQNVRGSSPSSLALVIVAVLLFGWGAYITWSREHAKLQEEQAKNEKPEIKIRLLGALHHILHTESEKGVTSVFTSPSFVTLYVGLVNMRQVPTTINGYKLKVFLERAEFSGSLVPSYVRFTMAQENIIEHSRMKKKVPLQKKLAVETITPLSQTITSEHPLAYMLEQKGYLHFITDLPTFRYEIEEDPELPAEFTVVLTLTDPVDGAHMGRFERVTLEPANLRIVGTDAENISEESRSRTHTRERNNPIKVPEKH